MTGICSVLQPIYCLSTVSCTQWIGRADNETPATDKLSDESLHNADCHTSNRLMLPLRRFSRDFPILSIRKYPRKGEGGAFEARNWLLGMPTGLLTRAPLTPPPPPPPPVDFSMNGWVCPCSSIQRRPGLTMITGSPAHLLENLKLTSPPLFGNFPILRKESVEEKQDCQRQGKRSHLDYCRRDNLDQFWPFGSFVLHLPIFYLLGFCWDDHSRPQMCWDRSQQLPSQTPTIHPSQFFWLNSFSVPKPNVASIQRYMCWDFVGMTIQTMINHWKSESVVWITTYSFQPYH